MRIKEGFILKKLGTGYVVVTVGQAGRDFNGMIRLNSTGAFLWQGILNGADTRDKLLHLMLESYEGLEETAARTDLDEFLECIALALE